MKATTLDLRRRMSSVIASLKNGKRVTLTHRGKVIGTIHPAPGGDASRKSIKDHPAFGMWADRDDMKDPSAWVREIRSKRRKRLQAIWDAPMPPAKSKPKRGRRAV